jgi:hypothetical protein
MSSTSLEGVRHKDYSHNKQTAAMEIKSAKMEAAVTGNKPRIAFSEKEFGKY